MTFDWSLKGFTRKILTLIFIALFLYVGALGLIFVPDRELWMSTGSVNSSYEKIKIKTLLFRGADPSYRFNGGLSSVEIAILNNNYWLFREFFSVMTKEELLEVLRFANKNSEDKEFIEKVEADILSIE